MTNAFIYIPAALHVVTSSVLVATFGAQCQAYCEARGYDVAGLINGQWSDVLEVVAPRRAGVVVVARPDHLDPNREPRIEIADPISQRVGQQHRNTSPIHRRPRRI